MNIISPSKFGFTVYSKSGCINCDNIKKLLHDNNIPYIVINCDAYLIENKELFLISINTLTNSICKTFPIVFNNNIFIGGFKEAIDEIYSICFDMEDNF